MGTGMKVYIITILRSDYFKLIKGLEMRHEGFCVF